MKGLNALAYSPNQPKKATIDTAAAMHIAPKPAGLTGCR